jgi:hypothetical protein
MMRIRFKVDWALIVVGTLILLDSPLTPVTCGEEFRLQIPQLAGGYPYGQSRGPVPFDLGACLAALAATRVEIAGTYSPGWWDGDDVEDFYHGPMGSQLYFEMSESWLSSAGFSTNGPFNRTITLWPQEAATSWYFLRDGTADLYVYHSMIYGWGRMTIPPQMTISSVTVVIEAERLFRITSFSHDGALCWTPMPTQGVIRLEFAPQLSGPWSPAGSTGSSNMCCNVTFPPGENAGFYRIVYSND